LNLPPYQSRGDKKPSVLAHRKAQMARFRLLEVANLDFIAGSMKSLTQNIIGHSS
jgi:hypothetical protein